MDLGGAGVIRESASNVLDLTSKKAFAKFICFFALVLWIIDIWDIPWLGGVYSGFNFNPQDFWQNWLSKFTFGNVYFVATLFIIFLIFVIRYAKEKRMPEMVDMVCTALFVLTMVFMLSNWGWMAYPKAILHFMFILTFGFFIWRTSGLNTAFLVMTGFFFLDFFIYSTILKYVPLLKYIFLVGSICIVWSFGESPGLFNGIVLSFLFIFIMSVTIANGAPSSGMVYTQAEFQKASLNEATAKVKTGIAGWRRQISMGISNQVQYAITGKVEQNKYEPLGVYLGELRSDQPRYYDNEPASIWGTIKARTLDEPVAVLLQCYLGDGNNRFFADKTDPEKMFQVFTLEEQDFACMFKPDTLKLSTSKTIVASADFNFETLAYVKRYFMDLERKRSMQRENQDPFTVFNIKERSPVSVSTNGPIEVGIRTNEVLYGVSYGYLSYPVVELSLQNRLGWEGKITSLKELILLFPKGAVIPNPESQERGGDCNKKFVPYDLKACEEISCVDIFNYCNSVCGEYRDSRGAADCQTRCSEAAARCSTECEYLFQEDGQQYIGYSLDTSEISRITPNEYDRFLFYRCKFDAQPDFILENGPITTKSFRVKARYNYRLEKTKTVSIQPDPFKPQPLVIANKEDAATVIRLARQLEVPEDIAFAVAAKASTFNHCRSGTCNTDFPEQLNCNYNKCGIMGIDRNYNQVLFTQAPDLQAFGCNLIFSPRTASTAPVTETAYDKECNIRIGLTILKQLKDSADYQSLLENPPFGTACTNQAYRQKYRDYRDWDSALRAYDGYSCTSPADPNYVENIRRIRDDYNLGKYSDIKTIADRAVSVPGSSSSGASSEYLGRTANGHSFRLSWTHPAGRTQSYRYVIEQIIGTANVRAVYSGEAIPPNLATAMYTAYIQYPQCTQCTFRITLTEYSGAQIGTPFTTTVTIPSSTTTSQDESTSSPFVGVA